MRVWRLLVAVLATGLVIVGLGTSAVAAGAGTYGYDAGHVALVDAQAKTPSQVASGRASDARLASRTRRTSGSSAIPCRIFLATETGLSTGNVSVYTSANAAGDVNYVGVTNNVARRGADHLAEKGITISEIPGLTSLSRADARAVEQVLIEANGGAGGAQLLNKINSISPTNPVYQQSIQRGCQLLGAVSYAVPGSVC